MNEPALLIIDVQRAIDDPNWGGRNNPHAEQTMAELLAFWRARAWPVIHVRHDSEEPDSTYRPGQPGNDFKPEVTPLPGETVVVKTTNSAFIGTGLRERLQSSGVTKLAVTGVITNNSVEATVRMAGNLGFETFLVEDACFTFGRTDWRGVARTADDVHAMSLANLHGEYCTVLTARELMRVVAM